MTNAIAMTILEQLGGNRFLAMTGAHSLVADGAGLIMKFPRLSNVWALKITLDASDTYTVAPYKRDRSPVGFKALDPVDGVYADSLRTVVESLTGLRCTL